MSGSGGVSIARARGENRFYNPPPIRQRQQQQQLEQQKRQQKELEQSNQKPSPSASAAAVPKVPLPAPAPTLPPSTSPESSAEAGKRTAEEECVPSVCSVATNLDRFLESTTPLVTAQYLRKKNLRQWRAREPEPSPYFVLGDLWDSYGEWSVYGAGVPLLLNGRDSVVQYYAPYLSAIQLYVDPTKPVPRLRKPGDESEAESSRETSSNGSNDLERGRNNIGQWAHKKNTSSGHLNLNGRVSNKDKPSMASSSDESEPSNSPGQLVFEYMERDTPYGREPLSDKISVLASQFPELKTYRSCDLSESSWVSVAWYPIYRIPTGPTLQNLEACFLTFHSLSTPCQTTGNDGLHSNSGSPREVHHAKSRLSLPIFGLASYKFKDSFWSPEENKEPSSKRASSMLRSADNWLRRLKVNHPDYIFFTSHHAPRR